MFSPEVIRQKNDLEREIWKFSVVISWTGDKIIFDFYGHQTRKSKRHKWKNVNYFYRHEEFCGHDENRLSIQTLKGG